MSESLFNVVFDGALTGEFDQSTTAARFARLFRLDAKRTHQLFSGKAYVIKNKVPEQVAMDLMIKVSEAGCECYLEELDDHEIPKFEEKRLRQERRLRFRRPPRPSAIVTRPPTHHPAQERPQDLQRFTPAWIRNTTCSATISGRGRQGLGTSSNSLLFAIMFDRLAFCSIHS